MSAADLTIGEMVEAPVGSVMYDRFGDAVRKFPTGWIYEESTHAKYQTMAVPYMQLFGPFTWGHQ